MTTGDDSTTPVATGATLGDGSYDLLVPASAVGQNLPQSAQLEVTVPNQTGGVLPYNGISVDLTRGSQNLGTSTIPASGQTGGQGDDSGCGAAGSVCLAN